jgi:UDP-N-acetylglucosamine--N-acetylmuramyl-(pentapeptide) pyrophosphoryl-undecaprenol N-acetylglucosamine transferase
VRTLLVASAGGHLTQLRTLTPRLRTGEVVWVTYDLPSAPGASLSGQVIRAHHPTTKSLFNAARNYQLARRVFARDQFDMVLSTGAAVAVPFMLRARQLGIPCHYIESATRFAGPSLSGRMLERVPGVHLYRQLGDWGGGRWQQGPRVFDGYAVERGEQREPKALRSAFVSLGTHRFAFSAAVERVRGIVPSDLAVMWQLGSTPKPPGLSGTVLELVPPDEMTRRIAEVDVVVGHAGVGLTLTTLAAGKVPVLVPRRRSRQEHTDDHQAQLAQELGRMGLAVVAEVGELTFEHLERAASLRVQHREAPPFELVD